MTAKRQAYDHVKAVVLGRQLTESGFVTEAEVATVLGVSRTPVREAFRSLEAEGLLQLVPNKGAFIPPVTDRQVVEVMEARVLVETFCAERALARDLELGSELRGLLGEQRRLCRAPELFIECDRRFHSAIVRAADHQVLGGFYESLRDRQVRMGVRAVLSSPERIDRVIQEHDEIVEGIESGSAERARAALEAHIEATLHTLLGDRVGR